MKTTIDLSQFNFNSRIFNQISDCPDTGFVRVLVYTGDNFQERLKRWFINAEIWFINQNTNKVVLTPVLAKSKNEDWVISNDYQVTVLDFAGNPTPNPNFVTHQDVDGETIEVPISETNLPFLTQGAFDRFSEFRVGTNYNLSMRQLWNMSVASDDAHGFFDTKSTHKSLVEIQTAMYQAILNNQ